MTIADPGIQQRGAAQRNPTMFNRNRLKLGVFASNCSGGGAATKVPERWDASWDNNLRLAQMADEMGFECFVPVGRWKGFGGETNPEGHSFETITWACGLLAYTQRITVFGTVHAPMIHPLVAAKQCVTADHIGHGRFGLNIVCGWNRDEFDMFGMRQEEHDQRYDYGQEWWEVIRRAWSGEAPFDYDGAFFKLKGVVSEPRPWGGRRPIMMNAGSSPAGRLFAARNSDLHFDVAFDLAQAPQQINKTRAIAATHGHEIQVFTAGAMVCRPTQRQAQDYLHYFAVENADSEAVDRLIELALGPAGMQSASPEVARSARERFAAGYGGPLFVGDPDHVALELQRYVEVGFDGIAIVMVNYLDELPFIHQELIPRLERMRLRQPIESCISS